MNMTIKNDYIIYEVSYMNKIIYIGMGEHGRELHVLSGKSNNPKLNELFFKDGENIKVLVIREGLTKDEALESERDFIMAAEPEFNIQHNQKNHKVKKFRKYT